MASKARVFKRGRIRYDENWESLGECFICEETIDDGEHWETIKVFFVKRGLMNWDILRILRNWEKDLVPYHFE